MSVMQRGGGIERRLIAAAAVVVIAVGLRWGAILVLPFILILYTSALVAPLYAWMLRKGLPKGAAIFLLILLLIGIFAGVFALVYFSFSHLRTTLSASGNQLIERLYALGLGAPGAATVAPDIDQSVNQLVDLAGGVLLGFLTNILGFIALGLVVLMGVVLLLLDLDNLRPNLARLLERSGPKLQGLRKLPENLVSYFVARSLVNLATATMLFLFLLVMRVPYAPLWALLAFFLSYVPYIGLTVSAIPPVILTFANAGLLAAVIIIVGYIILNQVAEAILEPKITGARLSLKPWFVFLAMFAFGWLMGPAGVFLAGPMTILLVIFFSIFEETRWVLELVMTDIPATSDA